MEIPSLLQREHSIKELLDLNEHVKSLSLVVTVYFLGWGIVTPILPIYTDSILGSYSAVGLVYGLYRLLQGAWSLLFGQFLDRVDKNILIRCILFLYLPLSPLLLSLKSLAHWIYFRTYHSMISSGLWVTNRTYIRDYSNPREETKAFGLFDTGRATARVLGGVIGAAIVIFLGFNVIYAVSTFAFLALITTLWLPEDHIENNDFEIKKSIKGELFKEEIKDFISDPRVIKIGLYTIPFYFILSIPPLILPLFFDFLGAGLSLICLITAFFYTPRLFESYFSTIEWKNKVFNTSLIISALLMFSLFFVKNILITFAIVLLLGVALAALKPLILGRVTQLIPKAKEGELTGVLYSIRSASFGISYLFLGFISDKYGLNYVFLIASILFLILIIFKKVGVGDLEEPINM